MSLNDFVDIDVNCKVWSQVFKDDVPDSGASADVLLCQAIGEIVVKAFDLPDDGFWGNSRGGASVAYGRQVSMYLAHVVCGLNFTQIGLVFERDRTTVSHACCLVEDRRDDQRLDDVLDALEHSILCLLDSGFYSTDVDNQWVDGPAGGGGG